MPIPSAGTSYSRRAPSQSSKGLKYLEPDDRQKLLDKLAQQFPETSGEPSQALSWEQVREMSKEGAEFGPHTVTHPILTTIPRAQQLAEIQRSTARVESEIGRRSRFFAYPNGAKGDFSQETIEILRSLEFRAACTTIRGSNSAGCDLLALKRIGIGSDSPALLDLKLSPLYERLPSSRR